jgi:hypothetical protein
MGLLRRSNADIFPPKIIKTEFFEIKTASAVFFVCVFVNYFVILKVEYFYPEKYAFIKDKIRSPTGAETR